MYLQKFDVDCEHLDVLAWYFESLGSFLHATQIVIVKDMMVYLFEVHVSASALDLEFSPFVLNWPIPLACPIDIQFVSHDAYRGDACVSQSIHEVSKNQ